VKNLNSFRFLKMALDYEIARQVSVLEAGGKVEQETRLYDASTGETMGMRSKEHAHDYRYFPEPDLVPLRISETWLADVRSRMAELPAHKRARFIESYGLREYDAQVLTSTREVSDYFEKVAAVSGDPRMAANWVMGDLMGALKAEAKDIGQSPVQPGHLGELVALIGKGEVSGKMAKDIFARMFSTGGSAAAIIEREGLKQISDSGALAEIVLGTMTSFPDQASQYRSGKTAALNFLVGKAMQRSKGQADPIRIKQMLERELKEPPKP